MNKIKSAAITALAIFCMGMFATATAQKKTTAHSIIPLPSTVVLSGTYEVNLDAVEVSIGTVDYTSGATYGSTWSGQTAGDLSGFMFVSLNYCAPENGGVVGIDSRPGTSVISGGSWSKVIFIDGVYAGSVSGTITGGELTWNPDTEESNITLQLTSDQGTEAFVDAKGKGTFVGVIAQRSVSRSVSGHLTLDY
jgi:hypothetical protein